MLKSFCWHHYPALASPSPASTPEGLRGPAVGRKRCVSSRCRRSKGLGQLLDSLPMLLPGRQVLHGELSGRHFLTADYDGEGDVFFVGILELLLEFNQVRI